MHLVRYGHRDGGEVGFGVLDGGVVRTLPGLGRVCDALRLSVAELRERCAERAGVTVPLTLERWGADPAVASSVFVTMVTDSMGFLLFLGFATAAGVVP